MDRSRLRTRRCIAYGCFNTSRYMSDLLFFKLPKDPERRREWLTLVGREDLLNAEGVKYRVCSNHFESFLITIMNKLRKNSTPSKLLYKPSQEGDQPNDVPLFCTCTHSTRKIKRPLKQKLSQERRNLRYKLHEVYIELRYLKENLRAKSMLEGLDVEDSEPEDGVLRNPLFPYMNKFDYMSSLNAMDDADDLI